MTMDKEQAVRPEGPGPVDGAHQARLDQGSAAPGGADGASGRSSMPVPAKSKAPIAQDTQELPATAGPGGPFGLDELDDDWDDEEIDRNRHFDAKHRARNRRITGVLALVAALGVGFAGGVFYQKHSSSSSSSTATGATPTSPPCGRPSPAGPRVRGEPAGPPGSRAGPAASPVRSAAPTRWSVQ